MYYLVDFFIVLIFFEIGFGIFLMNLCVYMLYLHLSCFNNTGTKRVIAFYYSCFWWNSFMGGRGGTFWGIWPEHHSSGLKEYVPPSRWQKFITSFVTHLAIAFECVDCWQGSTRTYVPLKRICSTAMDIWLCKCTDHFANWGLYGGKVTCKLFTLFLLTFHVCCTILTCFALTVVVPYIACLI